MPDVTDPAIAALETRARALDAADPLTPFADRFHRVPGTIYLDGSWLIFRGFGAKAIYSGSSHHLRFSIAPRH